MARNNKIIIFSQHFIPYGSAQSNRILSYARGLAELDADVEIFLSIPRFHESANKYQSGIISGVKYRYFASLNFKKANLLRKILIFIYAYHCSAITFIKLRLTTRNITVILQENRLILRFGLALLCILMRVNVYRDISEYPNFILFNNLNWYNKFKSFANLYIEIYMLNGIFFMTHNIKDLYLHYRNNLNYIIIPMTVEPDRFVFGNVKRNKTISYCGDMYSDKDGVPILIKAFGFVAKKYDDYQLVLIGDNADKDKFAEISKEIENSGCKEQIICTGKVGRDEIPGLLCSSELLVLARPNNIQAKGGFPTKLGEYLATGNPVVITLVGEIPYYLEDRVNAFISIPDDPMSFSNKIEEALSDKSFASQVGKNGQKLVFSVFNYQIQAKRIYSFILST